MDKEIEEIEKSIKPIIIDDCVYRQIEKALKVAQRKQAEAFYNAGYRKTVWHKVADGDLPKVAMPTIIYYKNILGFTDYRIDLFWDGRFVGFGEQVIAWTELPKYEGEE